MSTQEGAPFDVSHLPKPASEKAWAEATATALVGQLDGVRAAAEKWASTVAALIGAFGSVAVFAGADAVDKLPADWRFAAVVITSLAGLLAVVSIVFSALAVQGAVFKTTSFTTSAYRAHVIGNAPKALAKLRVARWTGMAAAALVFAASVASLAAAAGNDEPDKVSVLIVRSDGTVICGVISTGAADGTVQVAGKHLSQVAEVQAVDSC